MAATTAPSTAPWTELFEGRDGSRRLDRLRRIGLRITGCNDLASDAVQEAVIGLWRLRDDLPDDFAAWLGHAVVHRSLHLRRSALRRRRHEAIAAKQRLDSNSDPLEALSNEDLAQQIEAALYEVKAPYVEVLVRRYIEGEDYEAIARQLDLPVGTVRSRLARGRALLRERLGALGFDRDCALCHGAKPEPEE